MIEESKRNRINKLEDAKKAMFEAIDIIDDEIAILLNNKEIHKPDYKDVLVYDNLGLPTITNLDYEETEEELLDKVLKDEVSPLALKRVPND